MVEQYDTLEHQQGFVAEDDRVVGASYDTDGVIEYVLNDDVEQVTEVSKVGIGGQSPFEVDMIDLESDRLVCQISFSRELLDYGFDEFSYGQEHFRDVLGEDYKQLDGQEILAALSNKVDYQGDSQYEDIVNSYSGNCKTVSMFYKQVMDSMNVELNLREGRVWTNFDKFSEGPDRDDEIETAKHRWVETPDGTIQDPTLALRKLPPGETNDMPRSNYFFNLPILEINGKISPTSECRLLNK